jgi:Flp pilus assembly protein TadG
MPIAPVRAHPVTQSPVQAPAARAATQWRGQPVVRRDLDDRGSSSVEFVILFPIIIVLLFGGPQLAMWYFAREAAQAAAGSAARAASVVSATNGAGKSAADSYLAKVGTGTITSYSVDETDSATTVTIHIHVTVPNVIPLPGFSPSADVTVSRAKERFTTPDSP